MIQGERTLSISSQSSDSGQILSNPEDTRDYTPSILSSSSQTPSAARDCGIGGYSSSSSYEQKDTFGRLPVESSHAFAESSTATRPNHGPSEIMPFQCERCYAEFINEMKYLEHIQKCLDD